MSKSIFEELFEDKCTTIINNFYNFWSDTLQIVQEYNNYEKEFLKSTQNLNKVLMKKILYYVLLPFAFILFIFPGILVIKKIKKNNQKILKHRNNYNEAKENKIKIHLNILNSNEFNKFYLSLFSLLNLNEQGPLSKEIIDLLTKYSIFNLDYSNALNPWNSSWYIYDKNKIIISHSGQELKYVPVTYHGYTYHNKKTVSATYTHPKPEITFFEQKYIYMNHLSNLEFNLEKTYFDSRFFKNKNTKNSLENDEFDENFRWNRNDEVQFRMIFTPYTQERYLEEVKLSIAKKKELKKKELKDKKSKDKKIDDKKINPEDVLFKVKDFLGNFAINKTNFDSIVANEFVKFSNDPDYNLKDFLNNFVNSSYLKFKNLFSQTKYLYWLPIIKTINHELLIDTIKNNDSIYKNQNFVFYIISKIFENDFFKKDTPTFYNLSSSNCLGNNLILNNVGFLTHKKVKKTKYVFAGSTSVPVDYFDYEPIKNNIYIYYKFVNNCNDYYSSFQSDKILNQNIFLTNEKMINEIKEFEIENNVSIYIINKFLICVDLNKNENIQNLIFDFLTKLNNYYI